MSGDFRYDKYITLRSEKMPVQPAVPAFGGPADDIDIFNSLRHYKYKYPKLPDRTVYIKD